MPMGLVNAPEVFIQMINSFFMNMLDKRVVVILENILIYSNTVKKHFKLLQKVFAHLHKHAFYCKL